jgi:hypothetical protein
MSDTMKSEHAQVDYSKAVHSSRRSFLRRSAVVGAAVPGLIVTMAGKSHADKPGRKPPPQPLPNLFTGENKRTFFEILQDEEDHITALSDLSDDFQTLVRPTFKNLLAATPQQFVQMAANIENGGVGSYLQGLNAISVGGHHDYFLTAAGITAVEAQHTGFLNALLNQPIAPSALANRLQPGIATPIPPGMIVQAVSGFIDKLNGYHDFFTVPYITDFTRGDDANDQHIINFSLVLEFLEVEFYRSNIQTFFNFL